MGTPNMMYQETVDYIKELKESYGLLLVRNNVLAERVAELEDALKVEADENMAYKQRIAELELSNNGMHNTIERLTDRIAELEAGLREIANWSQEDQDDPEKCAMQWRGCVAIARELLKGEAK